MVSSTEDGTMTGRGMGSIITGGLLVYQGKRESHYAKSRNNKMIQNASKKQSNSPPRPDNGEKYQRPYPGYAFEFGNIDSYTQMRTKLSPIKVKEYVETEEHSRRGDQFTNL